ncbi:MAG: BTAD domain-containing putative transcriptional regulator [Candidatus Heteroscillospira sp.]|jgi:DNA-binding SARP family transcriptional activator
MTTKTAQNAIQVTCLGNFTISNGDAVLTDEINRSLKLWNVLCYLIVHRDRFVPQTELIELFWSEDSSANPTNALKTLLYRLRSMLEPIFGEDVEPILSRHGSYGWNPQVRCRLDIDCFDELVAQAQSSGDTSEQLNLYRRAVELYRGDFLPKLGGQLWVVPISARYHLLYLGAVKRLASLLCKWERFEEMEEVCAKAIELEPLDEQLHILVVTAMLRQGKHSAARGHYDYATGLLYRNLGVSPSEEMRALYAEIMDEEKSLETDLEIIQTDLREAAAKPGAFLCEYGFFKEIYRLEARRCVRSGQCVHMGLLTVTEPDGGLPAPASLSATMDRLQSVLINSLRRGDVVAKYSAAQFVVLLPAANYEDSLMVMNRIETAFHRQCRMCRLKLTSKVRELVLE